jgi:hypothetical protein
MNLHLWLNKHEVESIEKTLVLIGFSKTIISCRKNEPYISRLKKTGNITVLIIQRNNGLYEVFAT